MKLSGELASRLRLEARKLAVAPERRAVVVQLREPMGEVELSRLEGQGVALSRLDGRIASIGRFVGARVTSDGLAALQRADEVVEIMEGAPRAVAPLLPSTEWGNIHALTMTDRTWGARDAEGRRLSGHGVVFVDIDDGVDVFHPLLFHADGGYFRWLDIDGDGELTLGVDAVDRDGDGRAGIGETLRMVEAGFSGDPWRTDAGLDGRFTVGQDWLYADEDGDGVRDVGPEDGYGDDAPAFGEPLYLVDDVDEDGQLGPTEKLIALGTSKVRGVYDLTHRKRYVRGDNLTEFLNPQGWGDHGTAVSGILAGGVLDRTAVQGVAPDAEIVAIVRSYGPTFHNHFGDLVTAIDFARRQGGQIVLYEYGGLIGHPGDGGSSWERLLDDTSASGLPQLAGTHNFGGLDAHGMGELAAGEVRDVTLRIASTAWEPYLVQVVLIGVRWRGPEDAVRVVVVSPEGDELPVRGNIASAGRYLATTWNDRSTRGTTALSAKIGIPLDGADWGYFAEGVWTVRLENLSDSEQPFDVTTASETHYALGLGWVGGVEVTDRSTIAAPATADSAISVGACVGNVAYWDEYPEGLRGFSGRGPRIDGALGIDVVAPDDHYTATIGGGYQRFGGTSGAIPQVAGALGLLLQLQPGLSPADMKALVHERSGEDHLTGALPNPEWGYGRLLTHRLLFGSDPVANGRPVALADAPDEAYAGYEVELDGTRSYDPDGDELAYRWDFDYDGEWDAEVRARGTAWFVPSRTGRHLCKLEVEDEHGASSQVVVPFLVEEPPIPPEPDAGTAPDVGSGVVSPDAGSGASVDVGGGQEPRPGPDTGGEEPPAGAGSADTAYPGIYVEVLGDPPFYASLTTGDAVPPCGRGCSPAERGLAPWWLALLAVAVVAPAVRIRRRGSSSARGGR